MKSFSFDRVKVEGELEFKAILDLKMQAMVNKHATMSLFGIIEITDDHNIREIRGKKIILSYETGGRYSPIFEGVIQKTEVFFVGREYQVQLNCISYSFEFDKEQHSRSFQDIHMKYRDVLKVVAGKGRNIIFCEEEREIEKPIIQYKETDWEFCQRIAGQFFTIIIPEITGNYPQIALGMIDSRQYIIDCCDFYKSYQDYEGYRKKRQFSKCNQEDITTYEIIIRDNYGLGDKVLFRNHQMFILSKCLYVKNNLVEIKYILGKKKAMAILPYYNHSLCGLSLTGTVQWASREKIKIFLDIDNGREIFQKQLYAFDYAPVSGNLMYAIPEIGTRVQLYFSNEQEESGIVIESSSENILYPEATNIIFETKEHKRLKFTPELMSFRSLSVQMGIQLSDYLGTNIFTDKKINISSKGNICIQTDGEVICKTPLGYHFENLKTGDYISIIRNKIIFKTDEAIISGLPHKVGKKPILVGLDSGISNPMEYAVAILGAIPQGTVESDMQSAVLGGIPVFTNPSYQYDVSDLVSLGCNLKK